MNVEKQYVDLYKQYESVLHAYAPEVMNAPRAQALAHFRLLGFPSLKNENYRYTDVAQAFAPDYGLNLNRVSIPVHPEDVFRCDVPHLSTSLYFVVNDLFYTYGVSKTPLPQGVYVGGMHGFAERYPDVASRYYGKAAAVAQDAVTALNTLFAQDGFVLYVPQGVKVERPVQLVNIFRSNVNLMANRRILVILEPGAEARLLVCDHSVDDVRFLGTQVMEIFAGKGALFDYYDLEESSILTTRFSSVHVEQAAMSNVLVNGITLNNGLTRNNYHIRLHGEGAEATLCGLAIQDRQQHVDTYTHIAHIAPRCGSNELFKNVLNDRATGVFNGRILVEKGAEKTRAYQTNRNLCTSREVRMYSRPQLEIYADDVKCSHGMSTGQLDEQALFYMRARGLSYEDARMMLSVAFTSEVLEHVRLDVLKDRLLRLVEKRFRGELARCGTCRVCG
ncbi:MAG: Fe-S cluster assembly protein SufD [Tannerella sp.]|nr:Fe-S cluster assembly protein SufD [Tannerella sp.]